MCTVSLSTRAADGGQYQLDMAEGHLDFVSLALAAIFIVGIFLISVVSNKQSDGQNENGINSDIFKYNDMKSGNDD